MPENDRQAPDPGSDNPGYSSPACSIHEADPAYFGYWAQDAVIGFLNELLETERAGARALAAMAKDCCDLGVQGILHEVEAAQASFCVTLWREIEAKGGQASSRTGTFYERSLAERTFKRRIMFASHGQEHLVRKIAKALPRISEQDLHAKLKGMRELHQRQLERWKTLLG